MRKRSVSLLLDKPDCRKASQKRAATFRTQREFWKTSKNCVAQLEKQGSCKNQRFSTHPAPQTQKTVQTRKHTSGKDCVRVEVLSGDDNTLHEGVGCTRIPPRGPKSLVTDSNDLQKNYIEGTSQARRVGTTQARRTRRRRADQTRRWRKHQ